MTKRTPVWTTDLQTAVGVLACSPHHSDDLRSRAREIYVGAKPGTVLTPMNVEFITAMRSRFERRCELPSHMDPEAIFDRLWGKAWDAAK